MELALANALMMALETSTADDIPDIVDSAQGKSANVVKTTGPYISFCVVVYYVELDDGKTYTVTVDGR